MAGVVTSLLRATFAATAFAIAAVFAAAAVVTVLALELAAVALRRFGHAGPQEPEKVSRLDPHDLDGHLIIDGEYRVL